MQKVVVLVGLLVISFAIFFVFNPTIGRELITELRNIDTSGLREQIRLLGEMFGIR